MADETRLSTYFNGLTVGLIVAVVGGALIVKFWDCNTVLVVAGFLGLAFGTMAMINWLEAATPDTVDGRLPMTGRWIMALAMYFLPTSVALVYLLIVLWPTTFGDNVWPHFVTFWPSPTVHPLAPGQRELAVALTAGALGGYIQAVTAFSKRIGDRRLDHSWRWWYVFQPLSGLTLGAIVYFLLYNPTAPLPATTDMAAQVPRGIFGIAATCGLTGLFSRAALMKLREIVHTLVRDPEVEKDGLDSINRLELVAPKRATAGADTSVVLRLNEGAITGALVGTTTLVVTPVPSTEVPQLFRLTVPGSEVRVPVLTIVLLGETRVLGQVEVPVVAG